MMKFLRALFSPGRRAREAPRAETSVEYKGYTITPAPEKDPAGWRLAGTIAKEFGENWRTYRLDRADTFADREVIIAAIIVKAKRIIDEQGDAIFHNA